MLKLKKYIIMVLAGSVIFGCGARVVDMGSLHPKTSIANLEKGKTCIKI